MQAHRSGGPYDPDAPDIAAALLTAHYIFSGPGSPTYAARTWRDTLTLRAMIGACQRGATLTLSSAAAIAAGSQVMRVYEIFKAGADLGWDAGLGLLATLGLGVNPVIVPHWNNSEGGAGLDTSHCYIGAERFAQLVAQLPPATPILGIDEHTACILEAGSAHFQVLGAGSATIITGGVTTVVAAGAQFPLSLLGSRAAVAA